MNLIRFDASVHVKFYNKILQNFEKMTGPEKSFPPFYVEKFTYSFKSFTKCFSYLMLLLNGFMMVKNKWFIACKHFK